MLKLWVALVLKLNNCCVSFCVICAATLAENIVANVLLNFTAFL